MTAAQILAFLTPFLPTIESQLVALEQNELQPELQKLIATVTNPILKIVLTDLDSAIDAFIKTEIGKI